MSGKYDWESVDWANESNEDIAARLGCSKAYVSIKRKRGGFPNIPKVKKRRWAAKYDNVDWSRNDVDIAKDFGVTPTRIGQVRKLRNKPKVPNKNAQRRLELEHKLREAMSPDKTRRELADELGLAYNHVATIIISMRSKGEKVKVKSERSKYNWRGISWDRYTDKEIAKRVGCSARVANERRHIVRRRKEKKQAARDRSKK